jgi:pyrrolidone-carboxylate peptidase
VLVSGFGAFERVIENPSWAIARALQRRPPPGLKVEAVELPVSFARAPAVWDRFRRSLRRRPAFFLALGVSKEAPFRLERFGQPRLKHVRRPDVDGGLPRQFSRRGPGLECVLDLARLAHDLPCEPGVRVRVSRTAGGYVCERMSHHVLARGRKEHVPALFLHVPPLRCVPLETQIRIVRRWLTVLLDPRYSRSKASSIRGRPSKSAAPQAAKARTAGRKRARSRPM